ncbi:MAG: NAD(P)/FAD-dependent oxidoreductase, partial [Sulfitobacter litoralis]
MTSNIFPARRGVVIGAGPAGLMAAEMMAAAGLSVTVCDHKPSVARKLLMAGKSGLNITKAEERTKFLNAFT